jgi:hypothetical protein
LGKTNRPHTNSLTFAAQIASNPSRKIVGISILTNTVFSPRVEESKKILHKAQKTKLEIIPNGWLF